MTSPARKLAVAPAVRAAEQGSLGRVVIYTPYSEDVPSRAALITFVDEDNRVGLHVFNALGVHYTEDIPFAEDLTPGHWSWPKRA